MGNKASKSLHGSMDHKMVGCREAQAVHNEYLKSLLRMHELKPLVDKARVAHSKNELSPGMLKKILLQFADAQTEYTNVFRRVISLMADDDSDGDDFSTKPVLALATPEYSKCGTPPPYEDIQDLGITVRQDPGLRSRGHPCTSNNSRPTTQNSSGGGAGHPTRGGNPGDGPPTGGGNPGDGPPDSEADGHYQQGGCCGGCLRALLSALRGAFSAFLDLVATCLRALWDFIQFIGGKILDLAQMVRHMIAEGSQRMNQLDWGEDLVPFILDITN